MDRLALVGSGWERELRQVSARSIGGQHNCTALEECEYSYGTLSLKEHYVFITLTTGSSPLYSLLRSA